MKSKSPKVSKIAAPAKAKGTPKSKIGKKKPKSATPANGNISEVDLEALQKEEAKSRELIKGLIDMSKSRVSTDFRTTHRQHHRMASLADKTAFEVVTPATTDFFDGSTTYPGMFFRTTMEPKPEGLRIVVPCEALARKKKEGDSGSERKSASKKSNRPSTAPASSKSNKGPSRLGAAAAAAAGATTETGNSKGWGLLRLAMMVKPEVPIRTIRRKADGTLNTSLGEIIKPICCVEKNNEPFFKVSRSQAPDSESESEIVSGPPTVRGPSLSATPMSKSRTDTPGGRPIRSHSFLEAALLNSNLLPPPTPGKAPDVSPHISMKGTPLVSPTIRPLSPRSIPSLSLSVISPLPTPKVPPPPPSSLVANVKNRPSSASQHRGDGIGPGFSNKKRPTSAPANRLVAPPPLGLKSGRTLASPTPPENPKGDGKTVSPRKFKLRLNEVRPEHDSIILSPFTPLTGRSGGLHSQRHVL